MRVAGVLFSRDETKLDSATLISHAVKVDIQVLVNAWDGHRLLDSGDGLKLEELGGVRLVRSEPSAWWSKALPEAEWAKAAAVFEEGERQGRWRLKQGTASSWDVRLGKLRLQCRLMDGSKQLGVFAEQSPHWAWIQKQPPASGQGRLLNLFGYTGVASLVAAQAGWQVTHVDASKPAVAWGRRNQEASGLAAAPVRWIVEDALTFVQREAKRGNRYEAILLDPPAFGRGPSGEVWKVERDLPALLQACRQLLSPEAQFLLMTLYTIEASSILCGNLLEEHLRGLGGRVSVGELALRQHASGRLMPLSLWGRWQSGAE